MTDFALLEAAWRSSANNPSRAASDYLMRDLTATLQRRRNSIRGTLVAGGVMLSLLALRAAYDFMRGGAQPIDFSRESAVALLLLIPIVMLGIILQRYRTHARRYTDVRALPEAFRALLDDNAFARQRIQLVAAAYVVLIPIAAWAIRQLGEVDKMAPAHQQQMGIVFAIGLSLGAAYMAFKYFARLLPERRRLEALIQQYDAAAG